MKCELCGVEYGADIDYEDQVFHPRADCILSHLSPVAASEADCINAAIRQAREEGRQSAMLNETMQGLIMRVEELEREDFSDPDGDPTKPSQAMKAAEAAFIAVMQREYKNHWLKVVEKIEVALKTWCRENGYVKKWEANR